MAKEIAVTLNPGLGTVYAVVLNPVGQIFNTNTLVFEIPQAVNWAKYAILTPESNNSGVYEGDMRLGIPDGQIRAAARGRSVEPHPGVGIA